MARGKAAKQTVSTASTVTTGAPGDRFATTAVTATAHSANAASPVTRKAAHVVAAGALISQRSLGRHLRPVESSEDGCESQVDPIVRCVFMSER